MSVVDAMARVTMEVAGRIPEETIAVTKVVDRKIVRESRLKLRYLDKFRGTRGAISGSLSPFEGRLALRLSQDRTLLYVGDDAVRASLSLQGDGIKVADFVSVSRSNKLIVTEAKGVDEITGQANVDRARRQLATVAQRLQEAFPEVELGALELAIPRGADMAGDYVVRNGTIFVASTGQAVTILGKFLQVLYI